MSIDFTDIVEDVKKMSYEDKEELKFLLEKYLTEEKRKLFLNNYHDALEEVKENKINYSNTTSDFKRKLNQWQILDLVHHSNVPTKNS